MNLGILATTAGKQPKNFYHFLLDNECYATTGGQPVPNAKNINYAGMAKEAGYAAAYSFDDLETFGAQVGTSSMRRGPSLLPSRSSRRSRTSPSVGASGARRGIAPRPFGTCRRNWGLRRHISNRRGCRSSGPARALLRRLAPEFLQPLITPTAAAVELVAYRVFGGVVLMVFLSGVEFRSPGRSR